MSTSGTSEAKLALAREIANGMEELFMQRAYAIIAVFSEREEDLKRANSGVPSNKVIYIRALLALGKEKEALNTVEGLSPDSQKEKRSEAETAIIDFLVNQGRIKEAWDRTWHISDLGQKAIAMHKIALGQEEVIKRMASKIEELQRKLALANPGDA